MNPIFQFFRRRRGQKTNVNEKPAFTGEVSIYLANKLMSRSKSVVHAHNKKEALSKLEKAVQGDIGFRVKIKPPNHKKHTRRTKK